MKIKMEQTAQTQSIGKALLERYGNAAMHQAAGHNTADVMEWLKTQGAGLNARNHYGQTPIHHTAKSGNHGTQAMDLLKTAGADILVHDYDGETPMHLAATNPWIMKWLVEQKAGIDVRDFEGRTPMHAAAKGNSAASLEWLRTKGADPVRKDRNGKTPLDLARAVNAIDAINWFRKNETKITCPVPQHP